MKRNKGITLIALVITIIVLLILAGVAIAMLSGQNGILKKAADAKTETKEKSTLEQIKLGAMSAITNEESKIKTAKELEEALKQQGLQVTEGAVTGNENTGYKLSLDGKNYNITSKGIVEEEVIGAKQWNLTTDSGTTGLSVGDLLTPTISGLENEKFYVIADDETSLTLLAERYIDTATNKQVDKNYSNVQFDDDSNIYNGSSIQALVNSYVGSLTGLTLENVEVEYNADPVNNVKGRLMWYEEAKKLESSYFDIVYSPNIRVQYWLGSAHPNEGDPVVWTAYSGEREENRFLDGENVTSGTGHAIRPVIKILKSLVQ